MKIDKDKSEKVILFMKKNSIPLLENNVVIEKSDLSNDIEMSQVVLNGVAVFTGDNEDFKNCNKDSELPDFSSPGTLSYLLEQGIKKSGFKCTIVVDDNWSFKNWLSIYI